MPTVKCLVTVCTCPFECPSFTLLLLELLICYLQASPLPALSLLPTGPLKPAVSASIDGFLALLLSPSHPAHNSLGRCPFLPSPLMPRLVSPHPSLSPGLRVIAPGPYLPLLHSSHSRWSSERLLTKPTFCPFPRSLPSRQSPLAAGCLSRFPGA